MGTHANLAGTYFYQGYNCSQSVAAAFAPELGLSVSSVLKMTSGFGAGVGRLREVCGALTGAVFVLGTLYGTDDPSSKSEMYARVQEFAQLFRAQNGGDSLVCRELLGPEQAESGTQASKRTDAYYRQRPCGRLVRLSAELLENYLLTHPSPAAHDNSAIRLSAP